MSRRLIGIVVGLVSLFWALLTVYTEFIEANPNQYTFGSADVQQQMANCAGTFQQRYECKERILDAQQQRGFIVWGEKVAVILGPPLLLWALVGYTARQRRAGAEEPTAPRRVAAAEPRPMPRSLRPAGFDAPDPAAREFDRPTPPMHEPSHREPEPHAPHAPGGATPTYTGPRREPVRRRDR